MRRLLPAGVSLTILAAIYARIDLSHLGSALSESRLGWLAVALAMVVPTTALSAYRFGLLVPPRVGLGMREAVRLVLAASSLNMVLPSKMGDLAKAWFIRDRGYLRGPLALSLVVVEKGWDLLALLFWCALGLAAQSPMVSSARALSLGVIFGGLVLIILLTSERLGPWMVRQAAHFAPRSLATRLKDLGGAWEEMHQVVWGNRRRVSGMITVSIGLWLLHLIQIWLFARALGISVPFISSLALSPLAILAGLVPVTLAGIGTRDAAVIVLFAPWATAPVGAALGVLLTLRYLLPAAAGLPFLGRYVEQVRG